MSVTLKFHTDAALQVPVGNHSITHLVDGSNDPQDFLFYLGSTVAANKFEDETNPGIDQMTVVITNATALWQAATAYVVNDPVRTTAKNGYRYKVQSISGGGVTAGSEPTWPTTVGATVLDNEVQWVNDGKIHENTEIKTALTALGLDSAVAGADLDVGTVINGAAPGAVAVYLRIDDVTAVISTASELGISVKSVIETAI